MYILQQARIYYFCKRTVITPSIKVLWTGAGTSLASILLGLKPPPEISRLACAATPNPKFKEMLWLIILFVMRWMIRYFICQAACYLDRVIDLSGALNHTSLSSMHWYLGNLENLLPYWNVFSVALTRKTEHL
jgi:hypothetical protein